MSAPSSSIPSPSGNSHALPAPWMLCALFLLALLPLAGWYLLHHPDERHYTDAGIAMVNSGDWLTPQRPDGTLRFNKPILPYWCVAASYTLFGITPFASRLPFLLAGCATIWATYRLGKLIGESESAGRWAALVAVGNLQIVLAATRSIPDILLCLFTTISVYGVLSVLVYDRRNWQSYAAMYVGLGLAIASKGIPAIIVVGAVATCAIVYQRKRRTDFLPVQEFRKVVTRLFHWPTIAIGLVFAGGWFAAIYAVHGSAAIDEFAHDQVGARFEVSPLAQLGRVALLLLCCVAVGLPWIVPLVVSRVRGRFTLGEPRQRTAIVSMAAGIVVLAIAASFCNVVSTRYVVPVVPLCAAWLGNMLAVVERRVVERVVRWLLMALSALLCVVALGLAAANWQTSHPWLAVGCATGFALLIGAIVYRNALRGNDRAAVDFGLVKLAVVPVLCLGTFAFLSPDEGEWIVARIHALNAGAQPIQLIGKPSLAGKMRVFGHGRVQLASVEFIDPGYHSPHDLLLISNRAALEKIDLADYELSDFPSGIGRLKERDLLRALCRGELGDYLNSCQKRCYVAVRKRAARPLPGFVSQAATNR